MIDRFVWLWFAWGVFQSREAFSFGEGVGGSGGRLVEDVVHVAAVAMFELVHGLNV